MPSNNNYGFTGAVPPGVSVEDNVNRALDYQRMHTPAETAERFYDVVRNNRDRHLSLSESMDYKQIDSKYADFGNFNCGVISKAVGFPDSISELGAGVAQGKADGLTLGESIVRAVTDPKNRGDNPEDQRQIEAGMRAAEAHGVAKSDLGVTEYIRQSIRDAIDDVRDWITDNLPSVRDVDNVITDFYNAARTWLQRHDPLTTYTLDGLRNILDRAIDHRHIDEAESKVTTASSTSSPIALDLDGNGVDTVGVRNGAYFDHVGDGFAELTGWIGGRDGLLVHDLNGNGRVDNGAELFGNETRLSSGSKAANGFEALRALDSNSDGRVDASDTAFGNLKVWVDSDYDGYSQVSELVSLQDAGVVSIATAYIDSDVVDAQGNAHRQIGTFTRSDGATAAAHDVWFAVDHTHSLAETLTDVAADIARLPDLAGYGTVHDLRQAIALDTDGSLKELVSAFVAV